MTLLSREIRLVLAAIGFLIFAGLVPGAAQTSSVVNPNAQAVKEQQLLKDHYIISGRGTIADTKSYVIEQPLGRTWRLITGAWMHWIGALAILGVVALLALAYFTLGPLMIEGGRSGRSILRFNGLERFVHWLIVVAFVVLAVTGLNITFGREFLLPLVGPEAFSRWSLMAKYAHDFSSFPFVLGVAIMFALWAKANIPTAIDIRWFKEGGGMIGHKHPPAEKFNGGQKALFWCAMLGTAGVAITGLFLLFPFYWTNILGMQIAQILHALIAIAYVALIIAHIYIGAVGMEGGWEAMAGGEVDLNWAKQHHSLWAEKELGQGLAGSRRPGAVSGPTD
jgi:formate dehydrogenase subunit gamma